jgi:ubiquinone/menaquinone biosynthesis C-methylase UbiE/uncharacterized protein YbaR (Trm112 family)
MLNHMNLHLDIFICPACRGDLKITDDKIECLKCQKRYQVEDGIPLLFWPNEWDCSKDDITNDIKSFYEKTPFPNYEDFEHAEDLIRKSQANVFARLLNEQVPFNIKVLEVGCGTGQLSNFFRLGREFKKKNGLERVGFYQSNLFMPIFREESFPLVICNGVLHHTSDPFLGFRSISRLVKRGGYIIVGLYNKYGRITTDLRRVIFNIFNNKFKFLDPHLRGKKIGEVKKNAWFKDQYKNPHESKHTIGEVLKWFDETGFDFVNGIPKLKAFEGFSVNEKLFKQNLTGNWLDHFVSQTRLIFSGNKEGGFFLMIGKRKF